MTAAEAALRAAQGELGTAESPAGSNNVKYNAWFYGRAVSGSAYPWCMAFVQWCFAQAGAEEALPLRTASCGALMRAAKAAGQWVASGFRPGDVVIYGFSGGGAADHCGIVEEAAAGGVTAIEGNTSQAGSQSNGGMVCRKTRPCRQITGAVRPREEEMDFSKWTDGEILQLAERMQSVLARQGVSPALAGELEAAKAAGITDGSRPGALCTRAQAAVMALRAGRPEEQDKSHENKKTQESCEIPLTN